MSKPPDVLLMRNHWFVLGRKTARPHGFFTEIGQRFNKRIFYNFYLGYTSIEFDYFVPTPTGNNPTPGKSFQGGAYVELTPIDPLRFSVNYEKARLVRNGSRIRPFDSDIGSLPST